MRTLAPLYGLLCTAVYENLAPKMAMKLGNQYKFTEVQARRCEQFALAAGLPQAQTKKRVLTMAQSLPAVARRLQASAPLVDQPIVPKIVTIIEQRAERTARRLREGGAHSEGLEREGELT